ncbi:MULTISPECIES: hypothetical protein [unclassified Mesorhizobium]|uniref:hypothetical protein n=1 Tax=unclassified Mesorhizobium TaxID=325217 RepID=UPI00333BAB46
MTQASLIDNDVIIKISAYGLGDELQKAVTGTAAGPPAMLGVGRFVVRDRLARAGWIPDPKAALVAFEALLSSLVLLEPTQDELAIAAEFESAATRRNLELDGGESQLLTILLVRECKVLLTGDKRAIRAIAGIATALAQGKLACLEQVLSDIASRSDIEEMRQKICRAPKADMAASICFSCSSKVSVSRAKIIEGLESYTNHLRADGAGTLLKSADLSALTS